MLLRPSRTFHFVTRLEADFIIGGEQTKGYRLKCSCGKQLPPEQDRFYLTPQAARTAQREHERTGK